MKKIITISALIIIFSGVCMAQSKHNVTLTLHVSPYINEEEQAMVVSCSTNMPYLPQEEYLKKFLPQKVIDIFCINKLLEHELEEE